MVATMADKGGLDSPLLKVLSEAEARHARRLRGDHLAAARKWPTEKLIAPLPAGRVVQPPVRSDFLDLGRTLASLGHDRLSGYVRLVGDGLDAVALVSGGGVVAAMCQAQGRGTIGSEAFATLRRAVDGGDGLVDIVELPEVMLSALHQMFAGPTVYHGLRGRFLKGGEFIEHMSEQNLTGAIQVKSGGRRGVVLLQDGVLGAYTSRDPEPVDALDVVMELFADPDCEVTVTGGTATAMLPLTIL